MTLCVPKVLLSSLFILSVAGKVAVAGEILPTPTPSPTPTLTWEKDIQPIINENCSYCHSGVDASGKLVIETQDQVLKLKASITKTLNKGSMPPDDPRFASTDAGKKLLNWLNPPVAPVSYQLTIKPIIDDNCQRCHTKGKADGGYAFDTEAQAVKYRKAIASTVKSGSMPRGDRKFKNSAEAKVLLDWIASLDAKPAS